MLRLAGLMTVLVLITLTGNSSATIYDDCAAYQACVENCRCCEECGRTPAWCPDIVQAPCP